jgi:hypothetical protein
MPESPTKMPTPKRGADLLKSATKKILATRALAGVAKKDKPPEKAERERYPGPIVALLSDVCKSTGFAYAEVMIVLGTCSIA